MTTTVHGYGDLLHRALIRIDRDGQLMQTLLVDNHMPQEHRLDGFTGMALGSNPDSSFVVTGVVGADNATSSFPGD